MFRGQLCSTNGLPCRRAAKLVCDSAICRCFEQVTGTVALSLSVPLVLNLIANGFRFFAGIFVAIGAAFLRFV